MNNSIDLTAIPLNSLLVYDIETARRYEVLEDAPDDFKDAWELLYYKKNMNEEYASADEAFVKEAGLYPGYSNVVAISLGRWLGEEQKIEVRNGNYCEMSDEAEKTLIEKFLGVFERYPQIIISGFNVTGFDNPFIVKKAIIHGIRIPNQFRIWAQKPWEQRVFDLYSFWKMGMSGASGPGYVSLNNICLELGVPTPKDGICGANVGNEFWKGNCDMIAEYCGKDVKATMEVIAKIKTNLV